MDTWWYVNIWFLGIGYFVEKWVFVDLDVRYSAIEFSSICLFSWIENGRLWLFVSCWDKKEETFYMDVDMTCSWSQWFLCVLLLWIFDMLIMITFFVYWWIFDTFLNSWMHINYFRQVIFVDICGYLCVNSFETYESVLVICAGATNVFSWDLFAGFLVPFVRFWVSECLVWELGGTYLYSFVL